HVQYGITLRNSSGRMQMETGGATTRAATAMRTVKLAELVFAVALLGALYALSRTNYLLFHGIAEVFSSVVAFAIFALAWNSRHMVDNDYLLFIGMGYLFVAGVDLVHMLAYRGMGVFPGQSANLATQLWIVARYLEAFALLLAPLFLRRRARTLVVLPAFALATGLALASIFAWHIFPACFVDGVGLTAFKKVSEYIISAMLLAAIVELLRRRNQLDRRVLQLIVASIAITIGSEMSFTLYVDPYGFFNMLGHFLKIASFYLVYKAIIETGLEKPYDLLFRNLKESEQVLKTQREELEAYAHTVSHDLQGSLTVIRGYADTALQARAIGREDLVDTSLVEILHTEERMRRFIRSLLDYASAGHRQGEAVEVPVHSVLDDVLTELEADMRKRNIRIETQPDLPALRVDPIKLKQVLYNLVGNSVRYIGEQATPTLNIRAESDGNWATFCISDNGLGIDPDVLAKVFQPFMRGTKEGQGIGVGLSTVKRAVEGWGGKVWAESVKGEGSSFHFTAPLA
ncbi:MAG: ATP-binding protein, partial [Actinobacteria bacterium]|nr:ATP-binding protein [Actinomycetota bacterium]